MTESIPGERTGASSTGNGRAASRGHGPGPHEVDLGAIRAEFPILEGKIYLNSCSLGALSRRSESLLDEFVELWHTMGASAWYEHWLGRVAQLREMARSFLGAEAGSLALLPSTSAALSVIAESVSYEDRNRIVCTELDFPTLAYQWAVKPEVELVVLPSRDGVGIEIEQFVEAVDERTRFVATSHVFYTTGFVQDVRTIAKIAHAAGALCLIDGYQAAGQVEVDLRGSGVDIYTTGPLKWLCGGPGLAYLYVRPQLLGRLRPRITGWFANARQFDFDTRTFEPHPDARRFELGTPAVPTIHTAIGGQEIVSRLGIGQISARNQILTHHLVKTLEGAGFETTLPEDPIQRSAIVMIRDPDPARTVAALAEGGIIVDHRPGHVRVSPHFYNTLDELGHFVRELSRIREG